MISNIFQEILNICCTIWIQYAYIWIHMGTYMNKSIASGCSIALSFLFFSKPRICLPTLRPGVALPCRLFLSPEKTPF